jgi:hypothetical protein
MARTAAWMADKPPWQTTCLSGSLLWLSVPIRRSAVRDVSGHAGNRDQIEDRERNDKDRPRDAGIPHSGQAVWSAGRCERRRLTKLLPELPICS